MNQGAVCSAQGPLVLRGIHSRKMLQRLNTNTFVIACWKVMFDLIISEMDVGGGMGGGAGGRRREEHPKISLLQL